MPCPRPPHLHRERTRHGRMIWYVRMGKGPRIRIREEFGTPQFSKAYNAAISGGRQRIEKAGSGSLAWLIARYRSSVEWANLSAATRRQRENILHHLINSAGSEAYQAITRRHIKEAIDRRRETPFA